MNKMLSNIHERTKVLFLTLCRITPAMYKQNKTYNHRKKNPCDLNENVNNNMDTRIYNGGPLKQNHGGVKECYCLG